MITVLTSCFLGVDNIDLTVVINVSMLTFVPYNWLALVYTENTLERVPKLFAKPTVYNEVERRP